MDEGEEPPGEGEWSESEEEEEEFEELCTDTNPETASCSGQIFLFSQVSKIHFNVNN